MTSESWSAVLRDCKARGLGCPKLTIADGHLGIWSAIGGVYPESGEQRCWNHKLRNVLDVVPQKHQPAVKRDLQAMAAAETKAACEQWRTQFRQSYERLHPKAVERLDRDWERMVSYYDFPREHWPHIRTTNVVESPFSAVRLRTGAAKRFKKVANAMLHFPEAACSSRKMPRMAATTKPHCRCCAAWRTAESSSTST